MDESCCMNIESPPHETDQLDRSDVVMLQEEGEEENTNKIETNNNSKLEPGKNTENTKKKDKTHQSSAPAPGSSTQNNGGVDNKTNSKGKKDKGKEKSAKKARNELLSCPEKIVKSILDKTSYKVANLSELVLEKFNAPDYRHEVEDAISKVRYEDFIGTLDINISVLPNRYDYDKFRVNLSPSAITNLACIHQKPEKKFNWRGGRRHNKKRGNQGEVNDKSANDTESTKKNRETKVRNKRFYSAK